MSAGAGALPYKTRNNFAGEIGSRLQENMQNA